MKIFHGAMKKTEICVFETWKDPEIARVPLERYMAVHKCGRSTKNNYVCQNNGIENRR
jgi:hypothetical protein